MFDLEQMFYNGRRTAINKEDGMPKLGQVGKSASDIGIKEKVNGNGGARAAIAAEYDEILGGLEVGTFATVELDEGDTKVNVRNRLSAAADRRKLGIKFFKTRDNVVKFQLLEKEQSETE